MVYEKILFQGSPGFIRQDGIDGFFHFTQTDISFHFGTSSALSIFK